MAERRKKFFVDSEVQASLLRQLFLSWIIVVGVIASALLGFESYKADFALGFFGCLSAMWKHNAVLVVTLGLLSPFIVYDSIRLTHRFTGPMVKLRHQMKILGEGGTPDTIQFRKGDFWHDIAASFNLVVDRIRCLESKHASSPESEFGEHWHPENDLGSHQNQHLAETVERF